MCGNTWTDPYRSCRLWAGLARHHAAVKASLKDFRLSPGRFSGRPCRRTAHLEWRPRCSASAPQTRIRSHETRGGLFGGGVDRGSAFCTPRTRHQKEIALEHVGRRHSMHCLLLDFLHFHCPMHWPHLTTCGERVARSAAYDPDGPAQADALQRCAASGSEAAGVTFGPAPRTVT